MRAIKQVAAVATIKLMGLAICHEITRDYIRFQATSIHTIDAAMAVCEQVTADYGIQVVAFV